MSDDDWDAPVAAPAALKKFVAAAAAEEEEEIVELDEDVKVEGSKPRREEDGPARAKGLTKAQIKARDEAMAMEAERALMRKPMTAEERASEALRLRKLEEESSAELSRQLYGLSTQAPTSAEVARAKDGVQDTDSIAAFLMKIDLSTTKSVNDFATAVGKRLDLNVNAKNMVVFLKALIRSGCAPLSDEEVTELINVASIIKNDKVKAKLAKKGKKANMKPKLNDGSSKLHGDDDYDIARGKASKYDDFDDGDFM